MIIKISRGSHIKGIIEYHESKVAEGMAEQVSNNTLEEKTSRKIAHFIEAFEGNERVSTNKYVHFSLALSPEENLSNDDFKSLTDEYLAKMGYTDTPVLMYRHFDGKTNHLHAVVSSVRYDGSKVGEWKERVKGMSIQRELEKKYDLKIMSFSGNQNIELSELNAEKYTLSSAVKKGLKSNYNTNFDFKDFKPKFSNEDFIAKHGKEKFDELLSDLDRKGYVFKTDKMKMLEKLEYLYATSRDKTEFLDKVSINEMYVREVTKKGTPRLSYGFNGRYFEEKALPLKYSQSNLLKHFGEIELLAIEAQKKKIRFQVQQVLSKSKDFGEFKALLSYRDIEVKEATNSGGIYGLSFKLNGYGNAEFIKASDIDRKLSYNVIKAKLTENAEKPVFAKKPDTEPKSKTKEDTKATAKKPNLRMGHAEADNTRSKSKGKDKDDKFDNENVV